jgi:hypothetical protein
MNKERTIGWIAVWCRTALCSGVLAMGLGLAVPASFAGPDAESCATNTQSRQLDFWLGNWTVTYPGASAGSSSKVYLELGKCVLVENWNGGKGHQGINVFAYSADDHHWHGMFADNEGRVHVFERKVDQGSAEFLGPSVGPNGEKHLNRIRITRQGPDRVQQIREKSQDNGSKWVTVFQGEYTRSKSSSETEKPGR